MGRWLSSGRGVPELGTAAWQWYQAHRGADRCGRPGVLRGAGRMLTSATLRDLSPRRTRAGLRPPRSCHDPRGTCRARRSIHGVGHVAQPPPPRTHLLQRDAVGRARRAQRKHSLGDIASPSADVLDAQLLGALARDGKRLGVEVCDHDPRSWQRGAQHQREVARAPAEIDHRGCLLGGCDSAVRPWQQSAYL